MGVDFFFNGLTTLKSLVFFHDFSEGLDYNAPKVDNIQMEKDGIGITYLPATGSSVLWNAMIHPFLSLTIYGAIWYQGLPVVFCLYLIVINKY